MADPFSLAASVIGVAATALRVSRKLHELVQGYRDAPHELRTIAEQIRHNAVFLEYTAKLSEEHGDLFKDELKAVVKEVNGQFANISGLFDRLLPKSTHRKRDKMKMKFWVMWSRKKTAELVIQLEGLRNTLSLILNLARLTEVVSSRNQSHVAAHLLQADASRALDKCYGSFRALQQVGHHQLPPAQSKLLTFDETPSDMATWMALRLSAPTEVTKLLETGSTPRAKAQLVRWPDGLPVGSLVRAQPKLSGITGDSVENVAFQATALDVKTLHLFKVPYAESTAQDGTKELILKTGKPLKFHQVDMLVGMDLVAKISRWNIQQSPFLHLSKDETLSRLMSAWTTLGQHQIADALRFGDEEDGTTPTNHTKQFFVNGRLPASNSKSDLDLDSDLDSDSSGGADTANFFDQEEETAVPNNARTNGIRQDQGQFGQQSENKTRDSRQAGTKPVDSKWREHPPQRVSVDPALHSSNEDSSRRPHTDYDNMPSLHTRFQPRDDIIRQENPVLPQMNPFMGPLHSNGYIPGVGYTRAPANPRVTFWPPENPVSVPSPPPLKRFQKKTVFPETVGDDTSDRYRPNSPSMLDSPVAVRDTAKTGEGAKDRPREKISSHVEKWLSGGSRSAALESRDENIEDMRKRIRMEVQAEYLDKQRTDNSRERLETLGEIQNDAFEKFSADWKRREEQERRHVEEVKQGIRTDLAATQDFMTTELAALKVRINGLETIVKDEKKTPESREARMTSPFTGDKADDENLKQPEMPRTDYDVFDHLIVEYASTEFSTVNDHEIEVHSLSHKSNDDQIAFDVVSENGDTPSISGVERSRPWKGAAHLGNFSKMVPFYLRGSDAGQTWFRGSEPIYVVELQEGYDGEMAQSSTDDTSDSKTGLNPYLLISKFWVDAEALEKFGFKFLECPPDAFFLDHSLTSEDIQVVVDFTFALREVDTFKSSHAKNVPNAFSGIPPPPAFFTDTEQPFPLETIADKAFRWPWDLVRGIMSVLHVLLVLLRTIS